MIFVGITKWQSFRQTEKMREINSDLNPKWTYEPCHVEPAKTDRSWWIGLTECGPLEKGMASQTSVFLPWEPHEQCEKAKRQDTERWTPQVSRCQYAAGDQWRNNSRKNEEMEPKQKQHIGLDMTCDGSKVQCCKQQYCIGTWKVRSMNQGKLEVIKQEMARVNTDILGIMN